MRPIPSSLLVLAAVWLAAAAPLSPAVAADRDPLVRQFGQDVRGAIMNPRDEPRGNFRGDRVRPDFNRGWDFVHPRNDFRPAAGRHRAGQDFAWRGRPGPVFNHAPRRLPPAIHGFAPGPQWAWQNRAHRVWPGRPQLHQQRQFGWNAVPPRQRMTWEPRRQRRF